MKRIHIVFIVLLGLLLVASVGWGAVWMYASDTTVPEETNAGGISIGGMDIDEASAFLSQYAQAWEKQTAIVSADDAAFGDRADTRSWTLKELGYSVDVSAAAAAIEKLKSGGVLERARYRRSFEPTLQVTYASDAAAFDKRIREQWGWLDSSATKDATRTITDNDKVVYTPHQNAYRLDVDTLRSQVDQWVELSKKHSAPGDVAMIAEQKVKLTLPIKLVEPAVTLEKLKAEGIDRMIMSFTTDFKSSAEGRAYNVTSTAKSLNDVELAPDDIFDYGKIVSATEQNFGYREAPVIQNGKLVPGIGGGICQVSSTLYNAVLRAGLDIVERRNHSLPVSYLPIGQDATFADGAINFRFRNSTGKHLIIRTVVEDRKLTVKLFGTMPDNVRYDIESNTVKTIEPTVKETVSDQLAPGGRLVVQQGKPGYVVETYRTLVRDGEVVSRKRISRDTYKAQPTLVSVGKGTAPAEDQAGPGEPNTIDPAEPIIEDGIGAQGA